jgi:hypothetical protein
VASAFCNTSATRSLGWLRRIPSNDAIHEDLEKLELALHLPTASRKLTGTQLIAAIHQDLNKLQQNFAQSAASPYNQKALSC